MGFFLDIVLDAGNDTLALVPFLLITYLALEAIEHTAGERVNAAIRRAGGAGPAVGALLGAFPQCGFSAMAATLYAGRVVTLGTLVAVFLSTSDEMLPMLVAEHMPAEQMLGILGAKAAMGLVTGFAIDALVRLLRSNARVHAALKRTVLGAEADPSHVNCAHGDHTGGDILDEISEAGVSADHIHELCVRDHCGCDDEDEHGRGHGHAFGHEHELGHGHVHDHGHDHGAEACVCSDEHGHAHEHEDEHGHGDVHSCCCAHEHGHADEHGHAHDHEGSHACGCGHDHDHEGNVLAHVLRSAISHTVQVSVFIFIVTLALVAVLETLGEPALEQFLRSNEVLAVFGSALVGLVPNCSASVVITQLYLEGALGLAPMLAGTLVSAGVGYLVLFRTNRSARENLVFLVMMYVIGVAWGLVISLI